MIKKILIVGSGFAGAVIARELANADLKVDLIEKKSHVAGNCYTKIDGDSGIMEHVYGPHIFNTDRQMIWEYINKFGEMVPFVNRIKSSVKNRIFSFPINLHTINHFFNKNFGPMQAKQFIESIREKKIKNPKNFEEQALAFIGKDLYKAFFLGYTIKQWGCQPDQLPASILKRIPIRFNYDDNYYNKKYQAIPKYGYTKIIKNILDHRNIHLSLNTNWTGVMLNNYDFIFYSGPIDEFYDYRYGQLGYRTVYWKKKTIIGDYQGCAGINFPDLNVAHTRIYEHKHFTPLKTFKKSIVFKEYSKETSTKDIPFYPKRLEKDKALFKKYVKLSNKENKIKFIGRLGTYRYLDMEDVIYDSLVISKNFLIRKKKYED
jgi:UDP-galactopyranose mutase